MRWIWLILGMCFIAGCASQPPTPVVWPGIPSPSTNIVSAPPLEVVIPQPTNPPPPSGTNVSIAQTQSPVQVPASPYENYDRQIIDIIQHHWGELRNNLSTNTTGHAAGKVVVSFRVHSDGRISNFKIVSSDVGDVLTYMCERAVTDPAPYPRWPSEMIGQLGAENRLIRFAFSYE